MTQTAARHDGGDVLGSGLRALGVALPDGARAKLDAYVALLAKWNRTFNLTAIREPERMITHHLLDALAVLPHLPQAATLRVLDVGAGGGVPGIPLAIARPGWKVTLIDASSKKATFLTQAAAELGLANVTAVAGRVEDYRPAEPFDVVVSRAFADLRTFAETWLRHVADGLVVATPKIDVPGLDAARHLVVLQRAGAGR